MISETVMIKQHCLHSKFKNKRTKLTEQLTFLMILEYLNQVLL